MRARRRAALPRALSSTAWNSGRARGTRRGRRRAPRRAWPAPRSPPPSPRSRRAAPRPPLSRARFRRGRPRRRPHHQRSGSRARSRRRTVRCVMAGAVVVVVCGAGAARVAGGVGSAASRTDAFCAAAALAALRPFKACTRALPSCTNASALASLTCMGSSKHNPHVSTLVFFQPHSSFPCRPLNRMTGLNVRLQRTHCSAIHDT